MATFSQDAPFQAPPCLPENRKLPPCPPGEKNFMLNVAFSSGKLPTSSTGNNMCIPTTKDPGLDSGMKFAGGVFNAAVPFPSGQVYPGVHNNKYPLGIGSSMQHSETFVTVPFRWKRVIANGKVVYIR